MQQGYADEKDIKIQDELKHARFHYRHLSQIYGFLTVGIVVFGTCLAISIDLIIKDRVNHSKKGNLDE